MSQPATVFEWADAHLASFDTYHRENRKWNMTTCALMAACALVLYLYNRDLASIGAPIVFAELLILLVSSVLKSRFMKGPKVTLPQVYALHLVRIRESGQSLQEGKVSLEEFDDYVAALVDLIDADLEELEDNLAASITVRALTILRSYVLRWATAVAKKTVSSEMGGTIDMAANSFYHRDNIEELVPVLGPMLDDLKNVEERKFVVSRRRPWIKAAKTWYHLPPPVHFGYSVVLMFAFFWMMMSMPVGSSTQVWVAAMVASFLAIGAIFQGPIRQWLRSKLKDC